MMSDSKTVILSEHELPATKGELKLSLYPRHTILGIVPKGDKGVLVVEEQESSSKKEYAVQVVVSGEEVEVDSDNVYIGSYNAGGELKHVYGRKTPRGLGGPL